MNKINRSFRQKVLIIKTLQELAVKGYICALDKVITNDLAMSNPVIMNSKFLNKTFNIVDEKIYDYYQDLL